MGPLSDTKPLGMPWSLKTYEVMERIELVAYRLDFTHGNARHTQCVPHILSKKELRRMTTSDNGAK